MGLYVFIWIISTLMMLLIVGVLKFTPSEPNLVMGYELKNQCIVKRIGLK